MDELSEQDEYEVIIIHWQTEEQSRAFREVETTYTCCMCICLLMLGYTIFFFWYVMQ